MLFRIMSVLHSPFPTIPPFLQKWSGQPRPSPWCPCSSSSRHSSSATSDTSGRSAPSSPSCLEYSSSCQVPSIWTCRAHILSLRTVQTLHRNKVCKQSKPHRAQIWHCWGTTSDSRLFLVTVCFCFPITLLLCVVVFAKQPWRQTSVHSCQTICEWKVCEKQKHFVGMQKLSCSVRGAPSK